MDVERISINPRVIVLRARLEYSSWGGKPFPSVKADSDRRRLEHKEK